MRLGRKSTWPLQKVNDREQIFQTSEEYPQGYIKETLACGHHYKENIAVTAGSHKVNAKMRRCKECAQAKAKRDGL